ncbi:MAG: iron-sulfur cluster repair di-iron protein [Emticicia sp.]|uniref:iron-sulfur cluster repair di-iron protein n=1 Tax=Emticicia sp. TaxID=1930953 RepID=UPI003BA5F168
MENRFDNLTVGEIVANKPQAADVFIKLNVDFCCGGRKNFAEVCEKQGKDPQEVWNEIEALTQKSSPSLDFKSFEVDFLIDYVNNVHHTYLYKNLPEIKFFVEKVSTKHGEKYLYLNELSALYLDLEQDLLSHLPKEENIIFPYGKALQYAMKAQQQPDAPFFGTVANPIGVMHHEHERAGEILFRIREITNNYTPPVDACNSHLVMLSKLAELDADLIQHIHIENNILFPKIEALEASFEEQVVN